jgi:hypothetical protein
VPGDLSAAVANGVDLEQAAGQGFLADHVLARVQRRDGDLGMQVRRQADIHQVDGVIYKNPGDVRHDPAGCVATRQRRGTGRVQIADRGHG